MGLLCSRDLNPTRQRPDDLSVLLRTHRPLQRVHNFIHGTKHYGATNTLLTFVNAPPYAISLERYFKAYDGGEFVPGDGLKKQTFQPFSLVQLCLREVCRSFQTLYSLPPSFPSELITLLIREFKAQDALNLEVMLRLQRSQLSEFDLSNVLIAQDTWLHCFDQMAFRYLSKLDLSYCIHITAPGLDYLPQLKELRTLILEGCRHWDVGVLKPFLHCHKLVHLNLRGWNQLQNDHLKYVQEFQQMYELNLSQCVHIGDQGIQHLKPLTELSDLNLSSCPEITSLSMIKLGQFFQKLTSLNVSYCTQLTNQSMTHIGTLYQLEHLYLDGCMALTDEGIDFLRPILHLKTFSISGVFGIESGPLPSWIELQILNMNNTSIADVSLQVRTLIVHFLRCPMCLPIR